MPKRGGVDVALQILHAAGAQREQVAERELEAVVADRLAL